MKKQTAVEWLYERLERMIPREALYNMDKKQYFEQAKAMEKEQIKEAYYKPLSNEYWHKGEQWLNEESEIYYTSTYGQ